MAKWLLLAVLLCVPLLPCANEVNLQAIEQRLMNAPITQGNFSQRKFLKVLRNPLLSSGRFIYHQQQGVLWQTQVPVASMLLLNDNRLISTEGEQDLPVAVAKVFKALLGANFQALAPEFTMVGQVGNGQQPWQLNLTPKTDLLKKMFANIQLNGDSELRQLTLVEVNGNRTELLFSALEHPTVLTSAQLADFARLSHP